MADPAPPTTPGYLADDAASLARQIGLAWPGDTPALTLPLLNQNAEIYAWAVAGGVILAGRGLGMQCDAIFLPAEDVRRVAALARGAD